MRRTYRTLNDYEMQHNAEVGLFTRPSSFLSPFMTHVFGYELNVPLANNFPSNIVVFPLANEPVKL